jgi:hypothetical protein
MSITANNVRAESKLDDDYGYVTISVTWKGKKYFENPNECNHTQVMWSHDSPFGVVGSKVGDFIGCYGEGSAYGQEGVFTHRHIAELLCESFSGLKYHELEWHENPLEKTLSSGKPRMKKAKWLPEKNVDLVHLYSYVYVDAGNPVVAQTDFFTVYRMRKNNTKATWFMCGDKTAEKLKEMKYTGLYVEKITIEAASG